MPTALIPMKTTTPLDTPTDHTLGWTGLELLPTEVVRFLKQVLVCAKPEIIVYCIIQTIAVKRGVAAS